MEIAAKPLSVLARVLLAFIFVQAGLGKIGAIDATVANMQHAGIPYPHVLVYGAIALELGGGLMLMTGLLARWVAAAFFCYILSLAFIFHAYWVAAPAMERTQHALFFGHLSMMGGMLCVVAFGAGPWSLDALLRALGGRGPS